MAKLIEKLKSGSVIVSIKDDTQLVLVVNSGRTFIAGGGFQRYQTAQERFKREPGYINDERGESLSIGDGWRIDIHSDGVEMAFQRGW